MKLSLIELSSLAAAYLLQAKAGNPAYAPSYSDWTGALDKIGKQIELVDDFVDESPELEGEYLPLGKTIEEVHEDLFLPNQFDPQGAESKAPRDPTFRPACWSYTLEEKTFKSTVRMNKFEQSCDSPAALSALTATHMTRMGSSRTLWRNQLKRQLLGNIATKILSERKAAGAYAASTAYPVNTVLQSTASSGVYGIVVKPITSTSYATINTWALNVANGYIIVLLNVIVMDKPTDTATGEAYLQKVKDLAEIASAESEGYSLNGNTMAGRDAKALSLYQIFGIDSVLDVQVKSGAFQLDKLELPVTKRPRKNFGVIKSDASTDVTSKVFALLIDDRGAKLHNNYSAVRQDPNGEGDFVNELFHDEETAFISRNTFAVVFMTA